MSGSDKLAVGDRMKRYEQSFKCYLTPRVPVIIRVDGRAFHTLTRREYGQSNWHQSFSRIMQSVTRLLMKEIQGCTFAYSQSDEISLLITDYRTIQTDRWFGYDINKMNSIAASIASTTFYALFNKPISIAFDCRCFNIPMDDVCNYFIWRQVDATRNSINMKARLHFSQKELHGLHCDELQEKLFAEEGINFNDLPTIQKRGFCVIDGEVDLEIPIFTQDRKYIENHVYVRED